MAGSDRRSLYDLGPDEFAEVLAGEPPYRARQLWEGLYTHARPLDEITTLPTRIRGELVQRFPPALVEVQRADTDGGATVKLLFELAGGARIETVLMHYNDRSTVCVSTQAGCAMGCGFCATGQAGFERNLTVGEIVEQVLWARRLAGDRRVGNVVFMGMGEPLANYDRTLGALRRLHDDVGISARRLTVSTVGIVPGIRRLADEGLAINLAVSLHAADDALRDELVPINRRYPLAELLDACRYHAERTGRRLSLEWALIDGVNDRASDAFGLAEHARALRAHVNLIPLNPTVEGLRGTPRAGVMAFADRLRRRGVNVTVRDTRGREIAAACGQLAGGRRLRAEVVPVRLRTTGTPANRS